MVGTRTAVCEKWPPRTNHVLNDVFKGSSVSSSELELETWYLPDLNPSQTVREVLLHNVQYDDEPPGAALPVR